MSATSVARCAGGRWSMADPSAAPPGPPAAATPPPRRMLLVSSSGGVLLDLLALEPFWCRHDPSWAAVRASDTESALAGRRVHWLTEKSLSRPGEVIGGLAEAVRLLRAERPEAIVSAGTAVAIPFFLAACPLGIRSVWVETFNLVSGHGLAARLCSRLATVVVVQRESMRRLHPSAVLVGELF